MINRKVIMVFVAVIALSAIIVWLTNGQNQKVQKEQSTQEQTGNETDVEFKEQNIDEQQSMPDDTPFSGIDSKLHEIFLAALEFYKDSNENTVITQQNGILYNAAADIFITPSYLVLREYMPQDYDDDNVSVLYVSYSDVASAVNDAKVFTSAPKDASVTKDSKVHESQFTIYSAMPYKDGYIVESENEGQFTITKEQYDQILTPYKNDYGEIRRITASSDEYKEINSLLKQDNNSENDFYIRYGMRNDKYAVVIVSPKDDYNKVKMYVFAYADTKWEIMVSNLESVKGAKGIVVNVCRDFDLSLMPNYDLNSYMSYTSSDSQGVTETLISDGYMLEGEAEVTYMSKNDKFLFAKYSNNRMFVGVKMEGDLWVLGEVDSPENARLLFADYDEKAPDYVIIWE